MRNLCKYLLRPLIGIRTMTAYAHAVCGWTSPSPSQNTSFSLQPQYHHLAPSSKDQMLQRCLVCDALPHCIIEGKENVVKASCGFKNHIQPSE